MKPAGCHYLAVHSSGPCSGSLFYWPLRRSMVGQQADWCVCARARHCGSIALGPRVGWAQAASDCVTPAREIEGSTSVAGSLDGTANLGLPISGWLAYRQPTGTQAHARPTQAQWSFSRASTQARTQTQHTHSSSKANMHTIL